MRRLTPWLPELALLLVGFVLRATMVSRFDPTHGYDFISHWKYLEWMRAEHSLPDAFYSRSTYQPPLYYAAVTALLDRGMSSARIGTLWFWPAVCGSCCSRLASSRSFASVDCCAARRWRWRWCCRRRCISTA